MGDECDCFIHIREADALFALQLIDEAAFDVVNVFDALAKVDVFLAEELFGVFAERAGDGIFGGEAGAFNAVVERGEEGGVIEEAEVEVEDGSGFRAKVAGGLVAKCADIFTGSDEGIREALAFGLNLVGGDGPASDAQVIIRQDECLTDDHARRDADAFFNFHEGAKLSAARPAEHSHSHRC